jgi:selenium-binding protein 1
VLDTKPDPRDPRVVRTMEAEELASKAGYSRPHTVHCGPNHSPAASSSRRKAASC